MSESEREREREGRRDVRRRCTPVAAARADGEAVAAVAAFTVAAANVAKQLLAWLSKTFAFNRSPNEIFLSFKKGVVGIMMSSLASL